MADREPLGLRDDEEPLPLLVEASHALLKGPDATAAVSSIANLTRRLFHADACAIWRRRAGPGNWQLVVEVRGSADAPPTLPKQLSELHSPSDDVLLDPSPQLVTGTCAPAESCFPIYLPLTIHGARAGALAVYHWGPHRLTDPEIRVGSALASLAGAALTTAEMDEEHQRKAAEGLRAIAARARCLLWYAEVEDRGDPFLHWTLRAADEEAARRFLPVDVPLGHTYGQALSEARLPEDRARMARGDEETRAGRSYRQEFRIRDADGNIRWLEEDVQIEATGPNRWYAVGVCVDVTERHHLEQALQLRAEALAEADRRKDEFLAMLAHELRNPLGAITNSLLVLQHAEAGEAARERALSVLDRQVRQQGRMVDDLLDVSRITRGLVELRQEPVELVVLVRETVEDHRATFMRSGVELDLRVPDAPLVTAGDRVRLSQVLGNLLGNALKFTPSEKRVHVSIEHGDGEGLIRIRDTGIGIPAELLPHVFESFTQGDCSLARTQGGLGLGLALVRGLVEMHGGSVAASSKGLGHGAELVVRLPLLNEPSGQLTDDPSTASSIPSTTDSGVGRPGSRAPASPSEPSKRVLVVEDNRDAAETMRDVLELAGHSVELAHTGPAGILAAQRSRPDVVLCDIGLPGMDGYTVATALRQDPLTSRVRLIAISGYGQETDRERSRAAGFDHHLVKPIAPKMLSDLLASDR